MAIVNLIQTNLASNSVIIAPIVTPASSSGYPGTSIPFTLDLFIPANNSTQPPAINYNADTLTATISYPSMPVLTNGDTYFQYQSTYPIVISGSASGSINITIEYDASTIPLPNGSDTLQTQKRGTVVMVQITAK